MLLKFVLGIMAPVYLMGILCVHNQVFFDILFIHMNEITASLYDMNLLLHVA